MKEQLKELLPSLRRFCCSLTDSVHDADDLLQATVERLLVKGVPDDVVLAKWAFRVCRNIWIDEYRARRTRQEAVQNPELQEGSFDGEKRVHAGLALDEVNRALQQLPDDQRLVLSLVSIQGLSYREAADALDVPTGTVMSRLARARIRLLEILEPQD